jgi:hypothetical protein
MIEGGFVRDSDYCNAWLVSSKRVASRKLILRLQSQLYWEPSGAMKGRGNSLTFWPLKSMFVLGVLEGTMLVIPSLPMPGQTT